MNSTTQNQRKPGYHFAWTLVRQIEKYKIYRRNCNQVHGIPGPRFAYEVTTGTPGPNTYGDFYSLSAAIRSAKNSGGIQSR